jgi:hypothetical protein
MTLRDREAGARDGPGTPRPGWARGRAETLDAASGGGTPARPSAAARAAAGFAPAVGRRPALQPAFMKSLSESFDPPTTVIPPSGRRPGARGPALPAAAGRPGNSHGPG